MKSQVTKKQRVEYLKRRLSTEIKAATRALFRIYESQTESEKTSRSVTVYNEVGFTPYDAGILTGLVKAWQKWGRFTDRQEAALLKIMPKYAGQLLKTKCDIEKLDRMILAEKETVIQQ